MSAALMAPAPEARARFSVLGLLTEPARTYSRPSGDVVLEVVVRQHLQTHPEARNVLARYVWPDLGCPNANHAAAHSLAQRLPADTEVVCVGEALYPGHHKGEPVTVLDDVLTVRPVGDYLHHKPGHPGA